MNHTAAGMHLIYVWIDRTLETVPGVMGYTTGPLGIGVQALNVLVASDADEKVIRQRIEDSLHDSWVMIQLNIFRLSHHSLIGGVQ